MNYKYEQIQHTQGVPVKIFTAAMDNHDFHWHSEIEMIFVLKGTVNISVTNKNYQLEAGDIILINSNEIHRVTRTYSSNITLVCQIKSDFCKSYYKDLASLRINFRKLKEKDKQAVLGKLQKYLVELYLEFNENNEKEKNLIIHSLLDRMMAHILVTYGYEEVEVNSIINNLSQLEYILRYISENYQNKISISELADKLNFSLPYFSELIKKQLGISITKYICQYRLEKAKELLLFSNHSVSDVAMETGFCDLKTFIVKFKNQFGCTPGEYKKKYNLQTIEGKEVMQILNNISSRYGAINDIESSELINSYKYNLKNNHKIQ